MGRYLTLAQRAIAVRGETADAAPLSRPDEDAHPRLKATMKPRNLKLLTAPEPDFLSATSCVICGSRERWTWLDGRPLCRVCLILDLAPLTLVRQGWPTTATGQRRRTRGTPPEAPGDAP